MNVKIMNQIKFVLFMTLTLLLTYSGLAAAASTDTNLVANPGFDIGTTMPLDWMLITNNGNSPSWDTVAHSGTRSVRIQITGTSNIISGYPKSNLIDAQPATTYTLSAWGKSQSTAGTVNPVVRLVEFDGNKNWLRQTNLDFSQGTYDWTQKQRDFKTSSNTAYVYVYANIWGGYGTFWVDDVELKLKIATTTAPVPTPTSTITPNPTTSSGVFVNPDKTLTMNGKKTFPLMMASLCTPGGIEQANECLSNLKNTDVYDINAIGTHSSIYYKPLLPAHEETETYFVGRATTVENNVVKNNNYFFGYYQPDEPLDSQHTDLVNTYKWLKVNDPNHVVITGIWKEAAKWLDTADILIFGLYPFKEIFIAEYGSRDRAIYGYETIVRNNLGIDNFDNVNKPVWAVIQAVGCKDDGGVTTLSKTELRALQYTAITMNIKGLSYYSYSWTPNDCGLIKDPQLITMYNNAAREIKALNDVLVLPTKDYSWEYRNGTQVSFSKTLTLDMWWMVRTNFNYMLKQDGNTWYLIVVNKDIRPISDVVITINGLSGIKTATTIGLPEAGSVPGITLPVNNGKFTDSFDGYGVKIYKIS